MVANTSALLLLLLFVVVGGGDDATTAAAIIRASARSVMRVRPQGGRAVSILDIAAVNLSCTAMIVIVAFFGSYTVTKFIYFAAFCYCNCESDRREDELRLFLLIFKLGTNRFALKR